MLGKLFLVGLLVFGVYLDVYSLRCALIKLRTTRGPSGLPLYPWLMYVGFSVNWWPTTRGKVLSVVVLTAFHVILQYGIPTYYKRRLWH